MPHNVEYHIFAQGIKPMWEDEANKNGARWIFRIKKGSVNLFWEELILAYIGGQFTAGEHINGIVVSTRKSEDILALWLRGPCNQQTKESIREKMQEIWRLGDLVQFEYRDHPREQRENQHRKRNPRADYNYN